MRKRLGEILWVVAHLADLEADFLRFYGIHDMFELEARKFFRLAARVTAYGGVMTARQMEEDKRERQEHQGKEAIHSSGAEVVSVNNGKRSYLEDLLPQA